MGRISLDYSVALVKASCGWYLATLNMYQKANDEDLNDPEINALLAEAESIKDNADAILAKHDELVLAWAPMELIPIKSVTDLQKSIAWETGYFSLG